MAILPVSGLTSYNISSLNFDDTNAKTAKDANRQVTLKDIPYSYPISFKGAEKDMEQILTDSIWAKNIFEQNGISAEIDEKDGLLTISSYRKPYTDELTIIGLRRLLKNVKEIKGEADFLGYVSICAPNLKCVKGMMDCTMARNMEFPALTESGDICCYEAENMNFPALTKAGNIDCFRANNIKFPALIEAGNINCKYANLIEIPKSLIAGNVDSRCKPSIVVS